LHYCRYVAYTGYFVGLEKSQTIDRTRISIRGNRDPTRAYFQIVAPMVWFDQGDNPYKKLYKRKMAEGRPWYKAMPSVCAALARHIYHGLKFQEPYDVTKSFEGSIYLLSVIDRLTHHAHLLVITSKSYRQRSSRKEALTQAKSSSQSP
jgi:hypothetical protein